MIKHNFEACIFDMDGVVIDSEPLHAKAKKITLEHYKILFSDDIFSLFKGKTDHAFWLYISETMNDKRISVEELNSYKIKIYHELFQEVKLIEGVEEFMNFAVSNFHKTALVTSATQSDFNLASKKFNLEKYFTTIITEKATLNHKPNPEPYIFAMNKLNVNPAQTLIIEDSPNGIKAALDAGSVLIAITTSFTSEQLSEAGATLIVNSFNEIEKLISFNARR